MFRPPTRKSSSSFAPINHLPRLASGQISRFSLAHYTDENEKVTERETCIERKGTHSLFLKEQQDGNEHENEETKKKSVKLSRLATGHG